MISSEVWQRVDVSGTTLRLPGVTSSAAPTFRSGLGMEEGERRIDVCVWGGGTSGNDETDLSRSEGASSSVEGKAQRQSGSPSPALRLGVITHMMRPVQ